MAHVVPQFGVLCRHFRNSSGRSCRSLLHTTCYNSETTGQGFSQVLASDGRTIVCIHPRKETQLRETKPIGRTDQTEGLKQERLSDEHAAIVKQLRGEDPSLWTANTLARLFLVSPEVIGQTSPMTKPRQRQLSEEKKKLSEMRPHHRKMYRVQQEVARKQKLEEALKTKKHLFPFYKKESTPSDTN